MTEDPTASIQMLMKRMMMIIMTQEEEENWNKKEDSFISWIKSGRKLRSLIFQHNRFAIFSFSQDMASIVFHDYAFFMLPVRAFLALSLFPDFKEKVFHVFNIM